MLFRLALCLAVVLIATLAALSLSGCGGGDPTADTPDKPTPSVSCQQGQCA